jgi:hypothetical protein
MIDLLKVEHQSIKNKWQRRFARNHDGKVKEWSTKLSGPNVRFYVASDEKHELGFIRINDKSNFFARHTGMDVWNMTEAFVKPAYRHNGVLREMIIQSVRNLNVRMISISTDVFSSYKDYYLGLGFTYHSPVHNGDMTWAFHASFESIARQVMQERLDWLAMAGTGGPVPANAANNPRTQSRLLPAM